MLHFAVVAPITSDWPELSGAAGPLLVFIVLVLATVYFLGGPLVLERRDASARIQRFDTQVARLKTRGR